MSGLEVVDAGALAALHAAAAASPRRRAHRELHTAGAAAPVQQFLVGFLHGSYFRPHRHLQAHKRELTAALAGACEVLIFEDDGRLRARERLGEGGAALVQIPVGTWHGIVAVADFTVILEVKQGPYEVATDKQFADWAPPEGTAGAAACEQWFRQAQPGQRWTG